MEYAAAKSTICRQCGVHFSPAVPKTQIKLRALPKEAALSAPPPSAHTSGGGSLFHKFDGLWKQQRNSVVGCFECRAKQEVSGAASSTICPQCSAHMDLRDYKISTPFSRAIRTHGEVHLTSKGELGSSNVICRSALIEGKLRGNLTCAETATINYSGKVPGRLTAQHALVERRAEVQFFRRVRVKTIEIRGRMTGEIIAEGAVVIHRNASLDGNVTAKSITVEKGGVFSGQLIIGDRDLTQAELLPASALAKSANAGESDAPGVLAPLPAT